MTIDFDSLVPLADFDSLVPRDTGCNPATCPNGKYVDRRLDNLETRHPTLTPVTVESLDVAQFGRVLHERPVKRTLIAFTGLAGSGKSTAALHLVNVHGFERIRFAGPLKAMMAALGLTPEQIDGSEKETPCDLLDGRTPRYAMQTIGTEWGRDLIAPDLWIRAWQAALPATGNVVVDDCRFPNEARAVEAAGGLLVRIVRDGAGAGAAGHASEAHDLPAYRIVCNNGTVTDLYRRIDALL